MLDHSPLNLNIFIFPNPNSLGMRNRASLITDEDASNDDDDFDDEHDETNYDFIGSMIYQKAIKLRFQLLAITKPNQKRSRSENAEKAPDSWAISGYEEGSQVIWISTEIADYECSCLRGGVQKAVKGTKKDEHDHRGREFVCALRAMGKNDMNDHRREMASNAMDKDELLAPVTDDYKLVRLVQFYVQVYDSFDSEVKVYSLKANSWRRIQDFPYYLCYKRGYGVLANNALHWVVSRKPESDTRNLIVAFDLRTEDCFEVPQPDYVDEGFHFNVGVLGGCFCGLCNYIDARVDIWVMSEYGMKESWIKLFSVARKEVIVGFEFLRPLACSKSGDKVLLDQDNEILFSMI